MYTGHSGVGDIRKWIFFSHREMSVIHLPATHTDELSDPRRINPSQPQKGGSRVHAGTRGPTGTPNNQFMAVFPCCGLKRPAIPQGGLCFTGCLVSLLVFRSLHVPVPLPLGSGRHWIVHVYDSIMVLVYLLAVLIKLLFYSKVSLLCLIVYLVRDLVTSGQGITQRTSDK